MIDPKDTIPAPPPSQPVDRTDETTAIDLTNPIFDEFEFEFDEIEETTS